VERGTIHQDLNAELLPVGIDQLIAVKMISGGGEQVERRLEIGALLGWVPRNRIGIGRGEYLGRNLVLHRIEDVEFPASRQAGGGERRAEKKRIDALVLAVEHRLVQCLEVEGVVERFAHADVLELRI